MENAESKQMPKVSVIVPCYNVAPYILRCLGSLIEQTLSDIEIICVDDCSTDETLSLLKQYVKKDGRIKIIKQPTNSGAGAARNQGLLAAKGEYIAFCDPDDSLDRDFCGVLYNLAKEKDADIAKGIVTVFLPNGKTDISNSNSQIEKNKLNFRNNFLSAAYKRSFLKKYNINFASDLVCAEDAAFLIRAAYYADKIALCDSVSYLYYRRTDSLDSEFLSDRKAESRIAAIKELLNWANGLPKITKSDYQGILKTLCGNAKTLSKRKMPFIAEQKVCDMYFWFYENSKDKKYMNKLLGSNLLRAITKKNRQKLYEVLFTINTQYRLFGILPLLVVSKFGENLTEYKLLGFIPLITVRNNSYKKRKKIYFCGILIMVKRW